MTFLTPLGLLGLLGIAILILIYIIKPNYQQKMISSTYIWKLSLKYKKKRIPVSKLRNLLIILCQVFILAACAAILAKPVKILKEATKEVEVVAIIDSSASMRTQLEGESRFERAVNKVQALSEDILSKNGLVSVIVADNGPSFLLQKIRSEGKTEILNALNELLKSEETECSYGSADIEGALSLCQDIVNENETAKIYLYTDTTYSYVPEGITVVNVSEGEEWNAAVLDAYAEINDNYYSFYVDLACYGRDEEIDLTLEIHNANATDSNDKGNSVPVSFTTTVVCNQDVTKRIIFLNKDLYQGGGNISENVIYCLIEDDSKIYSYQSIHIFINVDDSFREDNNFNIYNGQKEVLKVQYASSEPEPFMSTALAKVKSYFSDNWDIQITQVKKGEQPALVGFDFYIFEHSMPDELPTDGVVFLMDPNKASSGAGFRVVEEYNFQESVSLKADNKDHALMRYVTAEKITVSRFTRIEYDADRYETLISYGEGNYPVLAVSDEKDSKTVVMGFSIHYSNLAVLTDFVIFMINTFEYFFPATVSGNSFEVNETITLNARGETLSVTSIDGLNPQTFDSFPAKLTLDIPGTYKLTQTTFTDKEIYENIYVKIPAAESNIWATSETLTNLYQKTEEKIFYEEWLRYVAAVLVAILFIEWWLRSRESM